MNNQKRITSEIFKDPEKWYHIRALARKLKISPNTVKSYIEKEKKKGVFEMKKDGNRVLCRANMENDNYIIKKKLSNLEQIYDSGIVNYLYDTYTPNAIVLFGSYSRGEDTVKSDLDIAVITPTKKRKDLTKFEKKLYRHIELSLFTYKEISSEFFNNLINGIVLKGFLKA